MQSLHKFTPLDIVTQPVNPVNTYHWAIGWAFSYYYLYSLLLLLLPFYYSYYYFLSFIGIIYLLLVSKLL